MPWDTAMLLIGLAFCIGLCLGVGLRGELLS